ncbi:MAG: hypothetical protein JSR37_08045 [Verrucomicrobia bacterium]|nr:hypothetical protein [Verrucomicrobiota bacterium]MBS0637650.1 hypothetical protein [Verrucomicrobiota bacterium]
MAYIKVPSWLELVKLGVVSGSFGFFQPFSEQTFWKEQALRFGFDIREAFDVPWQNFFYEKFFQFTLKRVDNNLLNLKSWEQNFWKRNGRFVQKLDLTSITQQDLELLLEWFPNLKHLILKRCNANLKANLSSLHTLEIHDVHLVSDKSFQIIPEKLHALVINAAKSISTEFFDQLHEHRHIKSLALQNCTSLELHQLTKLPTGLTDLDISGSGKNIRPDDACFFLPRTLTRLLMNRWDHFTDDELTLLPKQIKTLEVEGWQITETGLKTIGGLPLESLNISRIICADFYEGLTHLPKSLKKLSLSQNCLTACDLAPLAVLPELVELDISALQAYEGTLESSPLILAKMLQTLNLSYSGPLHKETLQNLKKHKNIKRLKVAGCNLDNGDLDWLPPNIEQLDLSLCTKITDVGVILLGSLSHLKSLILDGCEQIRGFGLSRLSSSVKKLSLAGCHRLSGKSLVQLPESLEELSLDSCELVMLEDIYALPRTLQVLSLARCSNIGNEACDFLSSLPLLNTISLQGCPKITEAAIAKLVRRKFEGTIIIKTDLPNSGNAGGDIELHPPISMLRKLTNFKARLIHKLKNQALR